MKFVKKTENIDKKQLDYVCRKYDLHPLVAQILLSRGFGDVLDDYLSGGVLYDPFLLNDMEKAVKCIKEFINRNEQITVYGDYDADGTCSSAIMYLHLKSMGAKVNVFLPNRHTEGYGLNNQSIKELYEAGTKLIITVDCGITSAAEVEFAKQLGMEVVVTDHHQCPDELPKCAAVINPLLNNYPCPYICGCGVALKLAMALGANADDYLDYAAIATVADMVPLTDENRSIVKMGLKKLNNGNRRTGISALCAKAGLIGNISAGNISFGLAPRINATGRLDTADKAFNLLVDDNYDTAMALAEELEKYNSTRKSFEDSIFAEAVKIIEENDDLKSNRFIIVCGEGWNKGVIGIVASNLVERYHRPVIVFSKENGVLVGSGRSIKGIHLANLLNRFHSDFIKHGGHEMAAGMTMEEGKLETFKNKVNTYIAENFSGEIFVPSMRYDCDLKLEEFDKKLVNDISKLEPLGLGNSTPIFRINGVEIRSPRIIGDNKAHLKFTVCKGESAIEAVAFSMGNRFSEIKADVKYDLLVNVGINNWNDREILQFTVREFKPDKESLKESFVVKNGDLFFNSLLSAAMLPVFELDQKRIRHMWNWETYLERRLKKDVLGTAVYTSVPTCAHMLMDFLVNKGVSENVGFEVGSPAEESCIVVAPDWNKDVLNCERLVIFDYAPTDFIARVLKNNPKLQIVICNNDDTENSLQQFFMNLSFERERATRFYTLLKKICDSTMEESAVISKFCALGKETELNAKYAISVFSELKLLNVENGKISITKSEDKKELSSSNIIVAMNGLEQKVTDEINIIKPKREGKGRK